MGAMQCIAFSVSKYGIHFFAIIANFEFGDKDFELGRFFMGFGKSGIL